MYILYYSILYIQYYLPRSLLPCPLLLPPPLPFAPPHLPPPLQGLTGLQVSKAFLQQGSVHLRDRRAFNNW